MTTQTQAWSSWTAFTISLNSLANGNYVAATAIDLSAVNALDLLVQVSVTVGTVGGNKRAVAFLQTSGDGSTYTTGPTSGSTTTDRKSTRLNSSHQKISYAVF